MQYSVDARLSDVRSDKIVPGRVLTADALRLRADPEGMVLSGKGALSGVPFEASWNQRFGPEHRGQSSVEGTVEISPEALDAFAIGLPKGSVSGKGSGRITLDLRKGEATKFTLGSDLKGLGLRIPEIGWSKAAGSAGRLELA
ncbi:MAG: hypothetical protein KDJ82_09040, partial [Rhodobacteraceae bacterium]|nr:hypothetical protein [Paracoccaceae bacterium]